MAIRNLRTEGDEILRKKCKKVTVVDDKIRGYLDDMMETLHTLGNGAALAANQVGILRRLVVIDYQDYYLKLVNPEIIHQSGTQDCIEGCLSFPDVFGKTIRPQTVKVRALDENGAQITITGEDDMAKCLCHELEHLDGVLFVDHVSEFIE